MMKKPSPLSLVRMPVSLSQVLDASGIDSGMQGRLLSSGCVTIDGQRAAHVHVPVDLVTQEVRVNRVRPSQLVLCRYVLLYKPYRVLCAFTDPEGRATLADHVSLPGIYAAGRLDYDSEGLMLLTDDGWLNHRLTHPRYDHSKTYLVQVERVPDAAALRELARGVLVKGERTLPATVGLLDGPPSLPERSVPVRYRASVPTAWLRIVLREGKKRQIRHMTAAVGHPTLRLVRVAIGPIELGSLQPGEWRVLTPDELLVLREQVWRP